MRKLMKEVVLALPNVVRLIAGIAADKRIPWESKAAILGAGVYFLSPIDVIPDFIPVLGQFDDILVVLLIADGILNHLDPEIVREHWHGNPESLERVRSLTRTLTGFIPGLIKNRVFHRARLTGKALKPQMAGSKA